MGSGRRNPLSEAYCLLYCRYEKLQRAYCAMCNSRRELQLCRTSIYSLLNSIGNSTASEELSARLTQRFRKANPEVLPRKALTLVTMQIAQRCSAAALPSLHTSEYSINTYRKNTSLPYLLKSVLQKKEFPESPSSRSLIPPPTYLQLVPRFRRPSLRSGPILPAVTVN